MPILDEYRIKASFYISPRLAKQRIADWQRAVANGHEIGNHTYSHPCSGNYPWSRDNALEDYTLDRIAEELDAADAFILDTLGVKPETFAYPCAQTFVGRGEDLLSYVPLIAERFLVGRHAFDTTSNAPDFCDLAQVASVMSDQVSFEWLAERMEQTVDQGAWLVLCSHEVGQSAFQTMDADVLDKLCRYVRDRKDEIWCDTVAAVGRHIQSARGE